MKSSNTMIEPLNKYLSTSFQQISNSFKFSVVRIYPDDCKLILSMNDNNRPINKAKLMLYENVMIDGEWKLNGEPILIGDDGHVISGQHRLNACILSGKPFDTVLIEGVPRSYFDTVDIGKSRTGSDVMCIKHNLSFELTRFISPAVAFAISLEMYGTVSRGGRKYKSMSTPPKVADWIERNPRMVEIATNMQKYGRTGWLLPKSQCLFLWFFMERIDFEATEEFFHGFITGFDLSENDPRLILRNKLLAMKNSTSGWTKDAKIGAACRAWSYYRRGATPKHHNNMWRDLNKGIELLIT